MARRTRESPFRPDKELRGDMGEGRSHLPGTGPEGGASGQPPGSADRSSPKGREYFIISGIAFRLSPATQPSECFPNVTSVLPVML